MDKKLIKVFSQEKASTLASLGFKYITETMNGQKVHSFFVSEDLMKYIIENFNKNDYLLTNKMTF